MNYDSLSILKSTCLSCKKKEQWLMVLIQYWISLFLSNQTVLVQNNAFVKSLFCVTVNQSQHALTRSARCKPVLAWTIVIWVVFASVYLLNDQVLNKCAFIFFSRLSFLDQYSVEMWDRLLSTNQMLCKLHVDLSVLLSSAIVMTLFMALTQKLRPV